MQGLAHLQAAPKLKPWPVKGGWTEEAREKGRQGKGEEGQSFVFIARIMAPLSPVFLALLKLHYALYKCYPHK